MDTTNPFNQFMANFQQRYAGQLAALLTAMQNKQQPAIDAIINDFFRDCLKTADEFMADATLQLQQAKQNNTNSDELARAYANLLALLLQHWRKNRELLQEKIQDLSSGTAFTASNLRWWIAVSEKNFAELLAQPDYQQAYGDFTNAWLRVSAAENKDANLP